LHINFRNTNNDIAKTILQNIRKPSKIKFPEMLCWQIKYAIPAKIETQHIIAEIITATTNNIILLKQSDNLKRAEDK